jgi:hypothetical protein
MGVTIEATPMYAASVMVFAAVKAVTRAIRKETRCFTALVASFVIPSLGTHSLSAVAPDLSFTIGGLAMA